MKLDNVNLIFRREVRDQFRDRRTLFMIFVLPMLLYPLLAMSMTQVAQFVREHPTPIKIIGSPEVEGLPPFVKDGHVAKEWLGNLRPDLLPVELETGVGEIQEKPIEQIEGEAQAAIQSQRHQAVLYFPPSFAHDLERFRQAVVNSRPRDGAAVAKPPQVPQPRLFVNSADEKSKMAGERVSRAVVRWTDAIGERILAAGDLPVMAAHPFDLEEMDVADVDRRKAAVWSKMLPFVLIIWALTGAFYPAIDVCAGEKERGTLETLLTSPAERSEIVAGKLLTVMLFSMATSALNLVSMGLTGIFMFQQFQALGEGFQVGLPPLRAAVWLFVALIPVSALFSALCIALASFARSNKEGQYYLVPVMLVCLPLLILPMSPGVELSLGYSLIPLTGLVLLLKSLLEGDYLGALPFVPPVLIVTGLCCLLALRWAIDQFNKESVLFRESERLDLTLWLRHLVRDRQDTPTVTEAIFCAVLILVIQFFLGMSLPPPLDFAGFVRLVLVSQLVVILTPPLLMTIMLTRSPAKTLLLRPPPLLAIPMAVALAICVHPLALLLHQGLQRLYPLPDLGQQFAWLADAPIGLVLLLVAVTPAICEELAFRGFILSGLRHLGHRWQAIVMSAVFFGITHQILQQSIIATVVGVVLGYLAVQTGSIFTGMAYHVVHNAVMVLHIPVFDRFPELEFLLLGRDETSVEYHPVTIGVAAFLTIAILVYFARLSPTKSAEEALQEEIGQQNRVPLPAEGDKVAGRPTKAAV